ncbi:unnamed protein product [Closterium sp. Naga37s-1]|nr:unnamed protein product [Closterium sp. Naga37s-1]
MGPGSPQRGQVTILQWGRTLTTPSAVSLSVSVVVLAGNAVLLDNSPVGSYPYHSFSCVPIGPCVVKVWGANSTCVVNSSGVASCPCAVKACSANSTCVVNSGGVASCVCDPGFVLQANGRTCIEPCSICDGNHACVKDAAGAVTCVCKYEVVGDKCVGPASCGACPAGAVCTPLPSTWPSYCMCAPGYGMTSTGCVQGATPTVSSTSFTFYDQPNFTIARFTSTMRVHWDGCTDITLPRASDVLSYTRIEPAPGGVGNCTNVCAYYGYGCAGACNSLFSLAGAPQIGVWTIP